MLKTLQEPAILFSFLQTHILKETMLLLLFVLFFFQIRIFQHFNHFFIHTAVQGVCYTKHCEVNLIMADYALSDKAQLLRFIAQFYVFSCHLIKTSRNFFFFIISSESFLLYLGIRRPYFSPRLKVRFKKKEKETNNKYTFIYTFLDGSFLTLINNKHKHEEVSLKRA